MTQLARATFVDVLRDRAAREPDRLAFRFLPDEVTLTYAELDARARVVARLLQANGAVGDRALLLYPPGLEFVAALFGCLYAGWIAVPAYPPTASQGSSRVAAIARDARPGLALTTEATLTRVRTHLEPDLGGLSWLATDRLSSEAATEWQAPRLAADDLAILQYTSGSTAAPRGVMLSHANLVHNTGQIERRFEIDRASRGVIWLPPFHDMGLIGGILQGVQGGFPITLMSPLAFLRRPVRWLEAISRARATISGGPNFAYDLCVQRTTPAERAELDLSSWTVAFNGAEPVRRATLERFSATFAECGFSPRAFYPCYGLAEATLMVTGGQKSIAPTVRGDLVSCGTVIDDQYLVIVDPHSRAQCTAGTSGEIWVRGPSVATGYWQQPELTRATFGARLDDRTYLRTGDLGFLHDGELYVTGRLKSLLIVGGRNLHAEDVERTVAGSHGHGWPGGLAAVSIDDGGHERLIVLQEVTTRADLAELASTIRLSVAEQHQVPVTAVVLTRPGTLPRTSSGKVRRPACRDALLDGRLAVVYEWRAGP